MKNLQRPVIEQACSERAECDQFVLYLSSHAHVLMSDASLGLQLERSLCDERIAICDQPQVVD